VTEVKCKEVRWRLAPYDSGELSHEEQQMVETHLASCDRCRQKLARLSKVPALIQSLHDETWWADVSLPVRERFNASRAKIGPSQARSIKAEKKGIMRERPIWRPVAISSLATAIMERPIWQPVLISLLALFIVVGASLAVIHPWAGDNIAHAAAKVARNNPQVQAILGEKEIETEAEVAGGIARVKCSVKATFVTALVNTDDMRVMAIHAEAITLEPMPIFRAPLTEDEKAEATAIAEAAPYIQQILGHGFALGEPSNMHPVLGDDPRRVAWVSLVGDTDSGEYRGLVVDLDDEDVIVIWEGEVPSWWPY
jgi:anti-sigma factor RsiW